MAIQYNDKAVLENFHVASAFKALSENPEINLWRSLSPLELKRFREKVISIVLATDMTRHFSDFSKMKALVSEENCCLDGENKDFFMDEIVHCADLINAARPFKIAQEWAERICSEFYAQGDEERILNISISFGCNKYEKDLSDFQVSFINGVVLPLYQVLTSVLPKISETVENLKRNQKEWKEMKEHYHAIFGSFIFLSGSTLFLKETEKICSDK